MKNLKAKGNEIKNYKIEKTTEKYHEKDVEVIHLTVESDKVYKFRVCKDDRHPDLNVTKDRLEKELKSSIEKYENFSVKKYKERNYLFINKGQYTGIQLQ